MMSEKYEISLIVESDDSPSFKLWILREERCKQTANLDTDFGVKIVEYQLRYMFGSNSVVFYVLLE
jgi:hypothetical protein